MVAVMLVDDSIRRRKAEATATALRAEEWIEDLAEVRLRDPHSGIADVDADIVTRSQVSILTVAHGDVVREDGDGPSSRHRLVSVDSDVGENLRQLTLVDVCPRQVCRQVKRSRHIRTAQGEADCFAQDEGNVLNRTDGSPSLCERQQLLCQTASLKDFSLGFLEEFVGMSPRHPRCARD